MTADFSKEGVIERLAEIFFPFEDEAFICITSYRQEKAINIVMVGRALGFLTFKKVKIDEQEIQFRYYLTDAGKIAVEHFINEQQCKQMAQEYDQMAEKEYQRWLADEEADYERRRELLNEMYGND